MAARRSDERGQVSERIGGFVLLVRFPDHSQIRAIVLHIRQLRSRH